MNLTRSYKYACGANVYLALNDRIIHEAVSLQWDLVQNKLPLYGYHSAEMSALASGQVLIRGQLAINYVSSEYLISLIRSASLGAVSVIIAPEENETVASWEEKIKELPQPDQDIYRKAFYWNQTKFSGTMPTSEFNNDITINFGRPDQHNKALTLDVYANNAKVYSLQGLSFTGRGQQIVIDSQPILEVFPFVARTMF